VSAPTEPLPTASTAPVDLGALFESLPLSDPDRHDLDPLDAAFARLAPGYPTEVTA
jgi:hypothetical protein